MSEPRSIRIEDENFKFIESVSKRFFMGYNSKAINAMIKHAGKHKDDFEKWLAGEQDKLRKSDDSLVG